MIDPRRYLAYGAMGVAVEAVYTMAADRLTGRHAAWPPRTSPWMLPVYGLLQPLWEPAHRALVARSSSVPVRAGAYALGFTAVEYLSGRVLRRLLGEAPWDYSHAPVHLHGLVRLDYLPVWAIAGLATERVHARLETRSWRSPRA